MDNSFYMIERNSTFGTDWFCAGKERWTQDANKAIHFPCKDSAREIWRAIMIEYKIMQTVSSVSKMNRVRIVVGDISTM